ncbi:MAG: hypothetical protein R2864_15010 [Syntrophotaleaceae bacterium]
MPPIGVLLGESILPPWAWSSKKPSVMRLQWSSATASSFDMVDFTIIAFAIFIAVKAINSPSAKRKKLRRRRQAVRGSAVAGRDSRFAEEGLRLSFVRQALSGLKALPDVQAGLLPFAG